MKGLKKKGALLGLMASMFIAQGALQVGVIRDFWANNYSSGKGIAGDLAPDQILLQLLGFREFVAGILWVKADGFFDEGNYDAVLPIVRVCTILDPKQLDIYSTGMWHIAYNFTDEEQRSDRRYIASALALGKEGAKNNPNTYEIFFETGWIWFHKVDDDYQQAVKWFEMANERDDAQDARKNILNAAYFRNNQLTESIDLYWKLLEEAMKVKNQDNQGHQKTETIQSNLNTAVVRMTQRGSFARLRGEKDLTQYDTYPPFDTGFSAQVTVEDVAVFNVVGTWNVLPVGTRIRCVIRDANNPAARYAQLDWDAKNTVDLEPDKSLTYAQELLFVRDRRFKKRIDLSRDRTMYPFSDATKEYLIEFYYNPRSGAPHIQDKFGYNGEGFTDKNFRNVEARKSFKYVSGPKGPDGHSTPGEFVPVNEDQPVMYASLKISRDQILRRGEWADKTPVLRTANFDPKKISTIDRDVIDVPSLRENSGIAPVATP